MHCSNHLVICHVASPVLRLPFSISRRPLTPKASLHSDEDSFLTFAPDFVSHPSTGQLIDVMLHAPGGRVPGGKGKEDSEGFNLWQQSVKVHTSILHLVGPANLDQVTFYDRRHGRMDRDTYWARPWPSGLALASLLASEPHLVKSKCVVELGAGVGAPGIIASLCGASEVVITDRDELSLSCASISAKRSGATYITTALLDFTAPVSPSLYHRFDLILATDVLHERTLTYPLAETVTSLIKPGGSFLLTEHTTRYPANLQRFIELLGSKMKLESIRNEKVKLPLFVNEMLDFDLNQEKGVDTTFLHFKADA